MFQSIMRRGVIEPELPEQGWNSRANLECGDHRREQCHRAGHGDGSGECERNHDGDGGVRNWAGEGWRLSWSDGKDSD